MHLFIILYGLFYVGLGFFVRKYPDTIAGYNTMSPRRKKFVDIDGLSAYLKKALIITGYSVIVVCTILWFAGFQQAGAISTAIIPVVILIIAAFRARKFDSYKKR